MYILQLYNSIPNYLKQNWQVFRGNRCNPSELNWYLITNSTEKTKKTVLSVELDVLTKYSPARIQSPQAFSFPYCCIALAITNFYKDS